jgi:hypothetical protein
LVHFGVGAVQVRRVQERAVFQYPGVVDQQADVRALLHDLGDPVRVGDVELDGGYPGLGDRRGVARRTVDPGRTPADQFPRVHLAEPPVGPGDQGNRSGDLHGFSSWPGGASSRKLSPGGQSWGLA